MRIITLVEKYLFYVFLFLCLLIDINQVYSQCPTVTNPTQSFCDSQSPTIASLSATDNGGGVKWYATSNSNTPLSNSTVLVNGEDYFADDNTGTCGTRPSVIVTIYSAPTGLNFQGVCVTDLSQAVITNPQFSITGNGLQWYTTPTGGTPLSTSTILNDNTIYYISQTSPDTGCQTTRLSVFVNVGLVPVPTGAPVQEFCNTSGNPPTVANLDASGNNNWYLTPTLGIPLDPSTPLVNGQFYYATTVDPPCESSGRFQVLVNIYEPNDAGNDATRGICINQVSSTSPFDLFNLLGGTPDNTGVWSGSIATSNGSQGTLDVSSMTVSGSPYVFTYTVSSAACATDTSTVTISILPLPTVNVSVSPTTICSGSNATFTFTGTPNATVTYTINGGSNQTIVLNASGTATLSNSYSSDTILNIVNVASSGSPSCLNSQGSSANLTVLPLPTASISASPTTICSGSSATITFTGTPNATVTYTINNGANQTIVLDASGSAVLNNSYTVNTTITLVSVTSSGIPSCTRTLSQTIIITVIDPTASVSVSPSTICSGANATVTFTGTPNATVTYTVNGGANQTIVLNASGTATLNNPYVATTTISLVSVTTSGSPTCSKPLSQSITINVIVPTASVSVSPTTICSGSNATVTFTGTPNATITYNINGGVNQTIVLNGSGTATLNNSYSANTTINLTSVSTAGVPNCVRALSQSVTITVVNPTATVSIAPTTICSGGNSTITFTGTPNATVTYTVNGGANQTIILDTAGNAVLNNSFVANTTITLVSVTSAGSPSCTRPLSQSVTLTIIPEPNASISVSPTNACSSDNVTITFTGTPNSIVTYTLNSGANQTINLNASGTAVLNGTYSVNTTITLISVATSGTPSCIKNLSQSTTITIVNPTASVSVAPSTICEGGSSTISFTGTPNSIVTYNINGGANQIITLNASGVASINDVFSTNTTITLVSVTTVGSQSCTSPLNQSVIITTITPPNPGDSASIDFCVTGSPIDLFTLLGSNAQTGGAWSPALASGTGVFNPAVDPSGVYTYTISGSAPCGDVSADVFVTVNPVPDAGQSNTLDICSNQNPVDLFNSLLGTPQPGGNWFPALASGTGIFNPAVDVSGVYTYEVSGVGGCPNSSATITTNVIPGPEAGNNNSITLCANAPTQDLFSLLGPNAQPGGTWSPALASGTGVFDPSVDPQGNYTYTLSGTQPCDNDTAVITVTITPIPNAGDDNTVTICSNSSGQDLFLSLGPNAQAGGTWSPTLASGTGVFNPATDAAQTYTYTVGTAQCGSDSATVTVSITQAPNSGGTGQTLNTCITTTSLDLVSGLNGTQEPGIWSDDNATGALTGSIFNPSAVAAGTYNFTYTVIGTAPCANATSTVTVIVNPLPVAGNNITLTICSNSPSQDLFTLLGSSANTGGAWSPALASGTGVFNPSVDVSGVYTYTVNSTYCSSVSATVDISVIQAPNSGGVGQSLNACVTNTSFDLFTGLNGTQEPGTWSDDNATGALVGNIFNPSVAGVGTYQFTYTVLGNAPCANATSTVTVTVVALPNAGTFTGNVSLCPSVGTIDLATLLTGQNPSGVWTDSASQSVTSPVNFSSFFPDIYTYTYSVTNVCGTDTEDVQFTVLPNPQLFSSNISISPVCVGTSATVNFNSMIDGTYSISYNLSGSNSATGQTGTVSITSGVGNFTIPNSLLPNFGTTVITFTNITNTSTSCSSILSGVTGQILIRPLADIDNTNLSATAVCIGNDVIVNLSNAIFLTDGVYQFNYTLPNATPSAGTTAAFNVTAGVGQFVLPSSLFTNAGNYTLTVIGIIAQTGCTNPNENAVLNFTINPIPSLTNATVIAQATCVNYQTQVVISGASNLPDGVYTIGYQLSGANTSSAVASVTITSGSGTFVIPATDIVNIGDTILTLNQIISTVTSCGQTGTIFNPITFSVGNLGTPQLIQDGNLFCIVDNPTIASLSANIVGFPTVIWYDAPTGGTAYADSDLLVNGTTYYAALVAPSGCESAIRLEVTVDLTACDDLIIPDGFSPNNDGINDTFEIANLPILYPNFKIEIFNRYGNIVYKGDINTPNWDGTTNQGGINLGNNLLPTGVYFYILDFRDGTRKAVQGRVYLNR